MAALRSLLIASLLNPAYAAVHLNGAGASFPADVYRSWLPAYKSYRSRFAGVEMKYESIGSGGGKARIKGETGPEVHYAGSDSLLSEEDYANNPDLQMFPSMAGAIVMGFYLPGISELNLKMDNVVDIYSGAIRWWNDSRIAQVNPNLDLPSKEIIVVARRDKSGTTEIFTKALASVSQQWADSYGVFSKGVDDNDMPYQWNASVVTQFGQTNRGVSGIILSYKFSIGYLVLSDAVSSKVSFARLQNQAGNMVEASTTSVQSAMNDFSSAFDERMTLSLANAKGMNSYPISGYTYIIIKKTSITSCESAIELVRYIEWFYTTTIPRQDCENLFMVPLSREVYTMVMDRIIKQITCKGQNVYSMLVAVVEEEELSLQTWRIPVFVGSPLLFIAIIIILIYLVRHQIRLQQALVRNEWLIRGSTITSGTSNKSKSRMGSTFRTNSNKIHPSLGAFSEVSTESIGPISTLKVGQWKGKLLQMQPMPFLKTTTHLSVSTKRDILWMRDFILHKNVVALYGLTDLDGCVSTAEGYCSKGSVYEFLQNTRFNMNNSMKYALCLDIAKGMQYLHRQGICHGLLTSKCCFLDEHWTVKVGKWSFVKLANRMKEQAVHRDVFGANDWDMTEFWTAPEILRLDVHPTEGSDVYSFSIIMQEIFTRDGPYMEHKDTQSPNDVLQAVISTSMRPAFTPDTPVASREIMERAWEMDPIGRPSFAGICTMIKNAHPKNKTLMDCMMKAFEDYTYELEEKLQGTKVWDITNTKSADVDNYTALPSEIAMSFSAGATPSLEKFDSASVLVSVIHGLADIVAASTASDIATMLKDLQKALDNVLSEETVHKFDISATSYYVVSGLPTRRNGHATVLSRIALSFLVIAKSCTIKHNDCHLQMKVGVATGPGMAGVLDPKFLMKYTVFGNTMDWAHTLANTTPPMTIQISEATCSAIQTSKEFTVIPAKPLDGQLVNNKNSLNRCVTRFLDYMIKHQQE
ncbi:atrial natriuretic peptide receptor 1-like [Haliotis rubra]|uniref:atrial natriuretic peptide receptor 1-like n=1 Tax=Haliotis rubra TaxID=36100 RepID=UPI001EE51471|nr:atrial natriuretic peptide receptor 1-like [Haliotis rubra]